MAKKGRYEVLTKSWCGPENCWRDGDDDLMYFKTIADAVKEVDRDIETIKREIEDGYGGSPMSEGDFLVRDTKTGETMPVSGARQMAKALHEKAVLEKALGKTAKPVRNMKKID